MQGISDLAGWPYQPNLCPADDDLIDFLSYRGKTLYGRSLFHMGPGMHHKVGKFCASVGMSYLGITASKEEWETSPQDCPTVWANLYDWQFNISPFNFMTLFHLGEMTDRFGEIEPGKVDMILKNLAPSGLVFFYLGSPSSKFKSSAANRVSEYVKNCSLIQPVGWYKSLQFYSPV